MLYNHDYQKEDIKKPFSLFFINILKKKKVHLNDFSLYYFTRKKEVGLFFSTTISKMHEVTKKFISSLKVLHSYCYYVVIYILNYIKYIRI